MKAPWGHSFGTPVVNILLLTLLSLLLAGCANAVAYQHTTTVKAHADELDVRVLGFVSDIHIKDGSVEVSFTTVITLGNEIK
jgi:hypothetical protein